MGEIFGRTTPAVPLAWTGERLTSEAGQQVEVEHLHRYLFARTLCRGLDVLDVASGEGYGSAFLAQTARSVVGVELDKQAVEHSRTSYIAPNLRFLEGDARRLPLPDGCIDVVISFETIEHFYEHGVFLAEVRRVLRPGGRFIVSSPERDVYSPANLPPNPYHVRELTRAEFSSLLHGTFGHVTLLGQRPVLGSALVAEQPAAPPTSIPTLTFERRGPEWFEASEGLPRPVYLLAIASDAPIDAVPNSIYIDNNTIEKLESEDTQAQDDAHRVAEALVEAGQYARHLESELAQRDREIDEAKRATGNAQAHGDEVLAELNKAQGHVRHLEAELAAAQAEVGAAATQLGEAGKASNRLKNSVAARDRALADATRAINRLQTMHGTAVAEVDKLSTHVQRLEADLERTAMLARQADHARDLALAGDLAAAKRDAETLRAELTRKQAELDHKSADLNLVLGSSIWRISQPVRSLAGGYPRTRQALRRTAKLAWWTATFQLPRRVATRLKAPSSALTPVAASVAHEQASLSAPESSQYSSNQSSELLQNNIVSVHSNTSTEFDQKASFTKAAQLELLDFISSGERLSFPRHESPDISVVVVLWNQAHLTLRCLRALSAQLGPSLEIVLVDNASTDETSVLLSRVDGVQVLPSAVNDGFLLGCNRGAAASRGRALLLLNSDAFVRLGALAAALATLDAAPDVGAVGGRLVLPSGRLQEAGSIIWSDASTLGYGRGLAQEAGEAMFRRDVDYCSGAFLLTPLDLWKRLGGFDEAYVPAYYEEADYCMRVRNAGYRVVYEPAAVIDHYEFGSEAKRGEAVSVMLRNRKRFRVRHAAGLRQGHLPFSEANMLAARERPAPGRRRLLVIDNEVPLQSLGAGYPRAGALLREAAAEWSVTFFPLHQLDVDWDAARAEIPCEIEIASNRAVPRFAEFLEERRGHFDAIIVSRPDNMVVLRNTLRDRSHLLDGTRLIYDAEALFSARDVIRAAVEGRPLATAESEARINAEVSLADGADAIICVNEAEASIFRARQDSPVHVLSHPTEPAAGAPSFAERSGFLFVGRLLEQGAPNWHGLAWFVRECWPLIRAALPDATLSVAGLLHPERPELEGEGIRLLGPVAELAPLYASARVFVAPIRFAAGVPIKILEATAAGLPTAGTRLMARQLAWTPGVEIVAEDDAAALATAAIELHEDAAVWEAMRAASQQRLEREHGATVFRDRLRLLLDGCLPGEALATDCDDESHRLARVEAVWGSAPPQDVAEQWATYPLSHPVVQAAMNRRATGDAQQDPYSRLALQLSSWGFGLPIRRAASLCCGAGALERGLAHSGLLAGCVGYDLATGALDAARAAAGAGGFAGLTYERRDLEQDGLGVSGLDLVLAHQGVHHLSKLEAVFDAVHSALVPGGVFHLHEFVGPDRFQWSDKQLHEMTAWLRSLPGRYRRTLSGAVKECAGRATIEEMIAHDPSEAVRSSAIEALVAERFEIVERRALGGTLAMMALAGIAQNFDPQSLEDVAHLDRLLAREDELIASGEIGSDFVVLVARRPAH